MILHGDDKEHTYIDIFNCQQGTWPIKYLGANVRGSRQHVEDWVPAEDIYLRLDFSVYY